MTVLWKGVRLCTDERYDSAWYTQRRLSVERRRKLVEAAERLTDELCEVVPGTHLSDAARLLARLLRDPTQWPGDALEESEGGRRLSRPTAGNPIAVLAKVVRNELKRIKVTEPEDQNELLKLIGLLHITSPE